MPTTKKSPAAKKNPSLDALKILIGNWRTIGSHPMLPGTVLRGECTFKWLEGGAFVIMHSAVHHMDFPAGIAIFGSDDGTKEMTMNYFDERKVSRKYSCTLKRRVWTWWRDDPEFSQRCTVKISKDGKTMVAKGEMKRKKQKWEKDLELTYTRI